MRAGALAATQAVVTEGGLNLPLRFLPRLLAALMGGAMARTTAGALALVMLVHAVETAKFVTAWTEYKSAIRSLAMGAAADPALGDGHFVSSERIGADLNRLSWFSTTQFLSVLVAPGLLPARLVVDPTASYFWLPCATATENEEVRRAIPVESRRLVRVHACLHR